MLNIRRTYNHFTRLIGLHLLGFVALAGHPALAQTGDSTGAASQRWYQVEVILFTQGDTQDDETWRNDVALTYPANSLELKNPKAVAPQPTNSETGESEATPGYENPKPADIAHDPFYILPDNLRELNRQADALKYSKTQRLLFHEAWRQPVKSPSSAPSIVIAAGERYGDHRELEGSFNLSVSRYLHLSTNLWLTDFMRNTGQSSRSVNQEGFWPELPTRPSQRRNRSTSTYYDSKEDNQTATPSYGLNTDGLNTDGLDTDGLDTDSLGTGGSAWDNGNMAWDSDSEGTAWDRTQQVSNEYDFSASKPYLPSQISVFRQERRMRSGEVHYIDHPKVGMVILVTPYSVPAQRAGEPGIGSGAGSNTAQTLH